LSAKVSAKVNKSIEYDRVYIGLGLVGRPVELDGTGSVAKEGDCMDRWALAFSP